MSQVETPRRSLAPSRRWGSAFALCAFLVVATGCRSALPVAPLSDSAVRLDLPLVRQDSLYDCGLASISALCQYWQVEIPADERLRLARLAAESAGLSGGELSAVLDQLGLEIYLFQGSLDRTVTGVFGHVDAGRPPLVMLSADGVGRHYELVLGYDEPRGNLILLDPMKGEILVPLGVFARNWERCQRFTLLACRREETQPVAQVRGTETSYQDEQTREANAIQGDQTEPSQRKERKP